FPAHAAQDARTFRHPYAISLVHVVALSADGKRLASGASQYDPATGAPRSLVKVWDVETGGEVVTLHRTGERIFRLTFSPDGQQLAVAGGPGLSAGPVRVWDLRTGQQRPARGSSQARCLAYSGDGKRLASGNEDGSVQVWEVEMGRPLLLLSD